MSAPAADLSPPADASAVILPKPLTSPENGRLLEAWSRWRGGRLLPRRSDIDLGEIKPLLPMITLQACHSRHDVRFTVVGTRIRDMIGAELTGANYIDLAPPEHREVRAARIEAMVAWPCGSLFTYHHRFANGLTAQAETLSFPIDPDQAGRPRMILSHSAASTPRFLPPPDPTRPLAVMEDYAFVDLGAGLPAAVTF